MRVTEIPTVADPVEQIMSKVLDAPLESLLVAQYESSHHTTGTDVLVRTGSDGWIGANRSSYLPEDQRGGRYAHKPEVRSWVRALYGLGATFIIIDPHATEDRS